jgi:hypothetical protein
MKGISQRQFAKLDGCTPKTVRDRIGSGHLTVFEDGSLDPELVGSDWRARTYQPPELEEEIDALLDDDGFAIPKKNVSEAKKMAYLALLAELQYDIKSGLVVPVSEVTAKVSTAFGRVRSKLLSIPTRVASKVVLMKEASEVKALLASEIALVLEELIYDVHSSSKSEPEPL